MNDVVYVVIDTATDAYDDATIADVESHHIKKHDTIHVYIMSLICHVPACDCKTLLAQMSGSILAHIVHRCSHICIPRYTH